MAVTNLTHETVERYAEILDQERFLCEERLGARSSITWQLRAFTDFMLGRIIPLLASRAPKSREASLKTQLQSFISSHLDENTLSHEIGYTSVYVLRDSLTHIELDAGTPT
jgi:hypothetical protein